MNIIWLVLNGEKKDCPFDIRKEEMEFSLDYYDIEAVYNRGFGVSQGIVDFIKEEFGSAASNITIMDVGARLGYNGFILKREEIGHNIYGIEFYKGVSKELNKVKIDKDKVYKHVYIESGYELSNCSDLEGKM